VNFFEQAPVLLTDLYQLTMLQGYFEHDMNQVAIFELFVRRLPMTRNFLIAAGLDQALEYLVHLRFSEWELDWLRKEGRFDPGFVDQLAELHFTGDVDALPEGTACFASEPILRVTAPLPEAQLVETRLLNLIHFQTVIASKAARSVLAAPSKLLVDFGLRRAHGAEAGILAARAAYLAGFSGTSNVLAGIRFGIPVFGTMAHSFIEAHDFEVDAFFTYARAQPRHVALLLDTYDTEAAAHRAVALAPQLAAEGIRIESVRLDSGSLAFHARAVRKILDAGGLPEVKIFASGNLAEREISELVSDGVPIDGFGIGTQLTTSSDASALDCAYKLMEYADRPRFKRSEGKATLPGRKQVFRRYDTNGLLCGDTLALEGESIPSGTPLLEPVIRAGRRSRFESLRAARARAAMTLRNLPPGLRTLDRSGNYPVEASKELRALARDTVERNAPDELHDR
jgi:nicotinate phosphoribosyltransferase